MNFSLTWKVVSSSVDIVRYGCCYRIEAKGKGFLQPHQLIAEFEAIPEVNRQKLSDGAFGEVLRSTQVTWIFVDFLELLDSDIGFWWNQFLFFLVLTKSLTIFLTLLVL